MTPYLAGEAIPDDDGEATLTKICRCGYQYFWRVSVPLVEADFARVMETMSLHEDSHSQEFKTQGGPDGKPKRDWVGDRSHRGRR